MQAVPHTHLSPTQGAFQTPCLACHGALRGKMGGDDVRKPGAQGSTLHASLPHAKGLTRNVKTATRFSPPAESTWGTPASRSPSPCPQLPPPLHCLSIIHPASWQTDWPPHPDLLQAITTLSALSQPSSPSVCRLLYLLAFLSLYQVCLSFQSYLQCICISSI